jgi:magnesium-transporting ATPase (P-type)
MELKNFSNLTTSFTTERPLDKQNGSATDVIMHMALCHTVIIDPKNGKYNSSSPDELALVQGAANLGFPFISRDSDNVICVKD